MTQFSTLLIGNEALTCQCGEVLLERGHSISAVVTRNPDVQAWALGRGLRIEAQQAGLATRLAGMQVDWVLSIANLHMISNDILGLARNGGVNFHDGPLPRYAGLNAPVWAILNGETRHEISWHLMADGVDEGDVLETRAFAIAQDDTALTLNTKCFEAAIDSFPALLGQLETGPLQRRKQDLSQRRLYLRSDRPAAMGRIDFAAKADDIIRLVRALDHGRYWNPLTTAKIATAGAVLNVGAANRATGSGTPGQVLSATDDGLVVACADGAVRLSRLTCQDKVLAVSGAAVAVQMLPALAPSEADQLTAVLAAAVGQEPRYRDQLLTLQPAILPMTKLLNGTADWQAVHLEMTNLDKAIDNGLPTQKGKLQCDPR